jgi:tRNA-dihydrouridine synthase A
MQDPGLHAGLRGEVHPISVAPMMAVTDRHFRRMMRLITRRTLLYTEMITTGALLQGGRTDQLDFDPIEHPIAVQLGGDDPAALAACAKLAEDWGYDEVNLNVGCPSDRVQNGAFGACLMARPEVVAEGVAAMRSAVSIPVTVKHRIGIDDLDRYEDMANFVRVVSAAGADRFSVHARKAWLQGLSPKQNRNVPPLRYADVHRLKADFPHVRVEINGGIKTLAEVEEHLLGLDGVMIGRAAADDPMLFASIDRDVYGDDREPPTSEEVALACIEDVDRLAAAGDKPYRVLRHMPNLFKSVRGARRWRRYLAEQGTRAGADGAVIREALVQLSR